MKKASAKIRNKVKNKLVRTVQKLESTIGRDDSRREDFRHHPTSKKHT